MMWLSLLWGAAAHAQDAPPPDPPPATSAGGQTFPGLMNPSLSFNGLFVAGAQWDDGRLADPHLGGEAAEVAFDGAGETFGTGLNVQEMELQLQSNVDPYFKANIILAIPGTEGIEVEEGYVQLVSVPRLLLTVGKVREVFGRENLTHTHAWLTIDKSIIGQRILGAEGLDDVAAQAAVLLPLPWFSEVTVAVDRGAHEVLYGSGRPEGLGTMAHWKNQLDLSYATSLEIGVSGATGLNAFDGRTVAEGVDVTLRTHGKGPHQSNRLIWQSEYLAMQRGGADADAQVGGLYSTVEYSFTRRFWLGGRFDFVGLPEPEEGGRTTAGSLVAVLAPTEFSALRLQAQRQYAPDGHTVDSVVGQLNFTIGAHPAHAY